VSPARSRASLARAVPTIAALAITLGFGSSFGCRGKGGTTEPESHHYDDKEAALAAFEEPERDAWAQPAKIVELLEVRPTMDIADIGAGSGYFTRRLATAASEGTTYAVDVDADFKSYIEKHREQWGTPNIVTRLAVYEHPLLPVDSVDLVFISNTYSFLQDRESYFTAVYKALHKGGRLAVIDWRPDAECPRALGCPKASQRVAKAVARKELERVGFTVLAEYDFLDYQYFMILGRAADLESSEAPPAEGGDPGPGESSAPAAQPPIEAESQP
jgi:predicted methyltransferase